MAAVLIGVLLVLVRFSEYRMAIPGTEAVRFRAEVPYGRRSEIAIDRWACRTIIIQAKPERTARANESGRAFRYAPST